MRECGNPGIRECANRIEKEVKPTGGIQWELPFDHAMRAEFAGGLEAVRTEAQAGAARFAGGKGRGGRFDEI